MMWADDETRMIARQVRFNKIIFTVFCTATLIGIILSIVLPK